MSQIEGTRRTPNSGATFKKKGDLQDRLSVFEAKTSMTAKSSYSVKKEELKKNEREAIAERKEFSILAFDFGNPVANDTYVVLKLPDFIKMYDAYKALSEEGE